MTIPDYQTIMLPLLGFVSDGEEHHVKEPAEGFAKHFVLGEEERSELLPSGNNKRSTIVWVGPGRTLRQPG